MCSDILRHINNFNVRRYLDTNNIAVVGYIDKPGNSKIPVIKIIM